MSQSGPILKEKYVSYVSEGFSLEYKNNKEIVTFLLLLIGSLADEGEEIGWLGQKSNAIN